jgi:alpha-tubulin suppressor-like RCC1 family protein
VICGLTSMPTSGSGRPPSLCTSGLTTARAIAAGYDHACARLQDGSVRCWGRNDFRQLGDGSIVNRRLPVAVSGVSGASAGQR